MFSVHCLTKPVKDYLIFQGNAALFYYLLLIMAGPDAVKLHANLSICVSQGHRFLVQRQMNRETQWLQF